MSYEKYLFDLCESTSMIDFKKKMSGNPGTSEALKIGEKFVKEMSLMRELDIEIVHFSYLIDAAETMNQPNQKVITELKKSKQAMSKARELIQKSIGNLSVITTDKKIVNKK